MLNGRPTRRNLLVSASALAASAGIACAAPLCAASGADMRRLTGAMAQGRFVTYQPTAQKAINGVLTQADDDSIRADLAVLRPYFDSLLTYGAQNGAERVADVAASLGFRAVVIGVWDFYNRTELDNALAAAARQPQIVAGISLGNEMVLGKRGTWGDLAHALATVRARAPGVPLTVTEPFAQFLDDPDARAALAAMNFMLVNIHPIFEPWFRSAKAVNWADFVAKVSDRLAAAFCGPVLVRETGVPSGPPSANFSEAMQHDFWRALEARMPQTAARAFSYFSAFDAPWRPSDASPEAGAHPEEAYWGMFTEARAPKAVMADMAALAR
jgi:exo-beta-1,3-glucanase (GH17 family)